MGDVARVSICFTKNTFFSGGGERVQLVNFFYKESKPKKKEGGARVCDFFSQRIQI